MRGGGTDPRPGEPGTAPRRVGDAGPDQRTPDLSNLIEDIVADQNWVPGNSMVFIISADGAGSGRRIAESFKGSQGTVGTNELAPQLVIQYLVGAAPDITVDNGAGDSAGAALAEIDSGLMALGTLTVSDVDTTDVVTADVTSVVANGTVSGAKEQAKSSMEY